MSTYPNLNNDPELSKIKAKDDEIEDLKYKTEKHDHESILIFLKIDKEQYMKEYKSLYKKNVLLFITEFF